MNDTRDPPGTLDLIEAIAAALRDELGAAIEQQPGFHNPDEAGQVNRAFRVVVCLLLRPEMSGEDDPNLLSDTLRRLARRRLEAGLLATHEIEHLLPLEHQGRDDWLAYLILTPWPEIEHLLDTRGPDSL